MEEISLAFGGQEQGTYSKAQVRAMYLAGTIMAGTLFWREGMTDWQPVDDLFTEEPEEAEPVRKKKQAKPSRNTRATGEQKSIANANRFENYPTFRAGYVLIRDGNKRFVAQIKADEIGQHIADYKTDFEIQLVAGTKWMPLTDLVCDRNEQERAHAALRTMSPNDLLMNASRKGDCEMVKYALGEGADIQISNNKPLHLAIENNHTRCVQLLINRGANPAGHDIIRVAVKGQNMGILQALSIMDKKVVPRVVEQPSVRAVPMHSSRVHSNRYSSQGFNCPNCGQPTGVRMDAGQRGAAFGNGNLLGAFSKTYRCGSCQYLW